MITLVIKNGIVVNSGDPSKYDRSHEIVEWEDDSFLRRLPGELPPILLDPRNNAQREVDSKVRYIRDRELARPKDSLMIIYRDMKKGTTEYVDAIDAINAMYPEPQS